MKIIILVVGIFYSATITLAQNNCAEVFNKKIQTIFVNTSQDTQYKSKWLTWKSGNYEAECRYAFAKSKVSFVEIYITMDGEKKKLRAFYEQAKIVGINEYDVKNAGTDEQEDLSLKTYYFNAATSLVAVYDDAEGKSICAPFDAMLAEDAQARYQIAQIALEKAPKL